MTPPLMREWRDPAALDLVEEVVVVEEEDLHVQVVVAAVVGQDLQVLTQAVLTQEVMVRAVLTTEAHTQADPILADLTREVPIQEVMVPHKDRGLRVAAVARRLRVVRPTLRQAAETRRHHRIQVRTFRRARDHLRRRRLTFPLVLHHLRRPLARVALNRRTAELRPLRTTVRAQLIKIPTPPEGRRDKMADSPPLRPLAERIRRLVGRIPMLLRRPTADHLVWTARLLRRAEHLCLPTERHRPMVERHRLMVERLRRTLHRRRPRSKRTATSSTVQI